MLPKGEYILQGNCISDNTHFLTSQVRELMLLASEYILQGNSISNNTHFLANQGRELMLLAGKNIFSGYIISDKQTRQPTRGEHWCYWKIGIYYQATNSLTRQTL